MPNIDNLRRAATPAALTAQLAAIRDRQQAERDPVRKLKRTRPWRVRTRNTAGRQTTLFANLSPERRRDALQRLHRYLKQHPEAVPGSLKFAMLAGLAARWSRDAAKGRTEALRARHASDYVKRLKTRLGLRQRTFLPREEYDRLRRQREYELRQAEIAAGLRQPSQLEAANVQ